MGGLLHREETGGAGHAGTEADPLAALLVPGAEPQLHEIHHLRHWLPSRPQVRAQEPPQDPRGQRRIRPVISLSLGPNSTFSSARTTPVRSIFK